MRKTLGLDLGSNSLGWAILDDLTGDVLKKGVVVFPEGIDTANDSAVDTPAAIRRAKRMGRRMRFRRKMRKWHLLQIMIEAGMCPLHQDELEDWKKNGHYPLANRAFIDWLKATDSKNPYCDRAAAADGPVQPLVLGRALYHLAQRRGFKSSRKDAATEDVEGENTQDKDVGAVKSAIKDLSREIADSGAKTLGQYFYGVLKSNSDKLARMRVRCRYTDRKEHYEREFAVIMDAQGYATDNPLRGKLHDCLFMQRPLRSQKHLAGWCPLEPKNTRASIGHPLFEEYRMLAFVNNLSFETPEGSRRPLTAEDRALVCTAFMRASSSIKFSVIAKLFKNDPRFKVEGWKFHYYHDDDTVATCQTLHRLRSAFGDIPFDVQKVYDALTFYDDDEKLRGWFARHFPALDGKTIAQLVAIHPKEGNAQYSLKAIRMILRFLRKGYELSEARFYAKLPDEISTFEENEERIIDNLKAILFEYRREKEERSHGDEWKGTKIKPLFDRYRLYLRDNWNVDDASWNRLYLRGDATYRVSTTGRLPAVELGMIRNPLVQRSMTTLRRLVNYLRDHEMIDGDTTIRIELARNVNDFATRTAWQKWQKSRQEIRDQARSEIAKYGVAVTEDAIDRYVLYKEQNHCCLYTGSQISIAELLVGNVFDIEHTIPRSLSGDDSLANKTICEIAYNRQTKKGRVPKDCPNWDEIEIRLRPWRDKLEQLEKDCRSRQRAAKGVLDPAARSAARVKYLVTRFERDYWRDKLRRFEIEASALRENGGTLGGFKRRQLVDTGIMCSHAVELLRSAYPATFAVNGTATAFARKAWGIQDDGEKDRSEHTHHAKDAMVIAALTPVRFTAICTALKDDGSGSFRRPCDVCPPPFPDFAEKVRRACGEILVKHVLRQTTLRQSSKKNALAKAHPPRNNPDGKPIKFVNSKGDTVRGALHKETYYGKIVDPLSGQMRTVQRLSLEGKVADVRKIIPNIVDPAVRERVRQCVDLLESNGVKLVSPGDIAMASGVPIKKVRVFAPKTFQNPDAIARHDYVSHLEYKQFLYAGTAENSNFRMAVFCKGGVFSYETEGKLAWAKLHKNTEYVPAENREGFLGYVYPGSMLIAREGLDCQNLENLTAAELAKRLFWLRTLPSAKEKRGELQFHVEARAKGDIPDEARASSFAKGKTLLRIVASNIMKDFLIEGIHFRMKMDGSIDFIRR